MKWEFPGGKIELGESAEECIVREIKEELNLHITVVARLSSYSHCYDNKLIELIPFICSCVGGEIRLTEHSQFLWTTVEELSEFDWAEADIPVVHEYIKLAKQ